MMNLEEIAEKISKPNSRTLENEENEIIEQEKENFINQIKEQLNNIHINPTTDQSISLEVKKKDLPNIIESDSEGEFFQVQRDDKQAVCM
jgi:hypothetical protein